MHTQIPFHHLSCLPLIAHPWKLQGHFSSSSSHKLRLASSDEPAVQQLTATDGADLALYLGLLSHHLMNNIIYENENVAVCIFFFKMVYIERMAVKQL
jgi:hypothetical protein